MSLPTRRSGAKVLRPGIRRCQHLGGIVYVSQRMHEIGNVHEVAEVGCVERPVPRLTISEERAPLCLVEAASLCLASHKRTELVAANHAADARPHQALGSPLLLGSAHDRRRTRRSAWRRRHDLRFYRNLWVFPAFSRHGRCTGMHIAHQLFNVTAVGEACGQFRVRILLGRRTAHRHQAGVLRFFPGLIMHTASRFCSRHNPTTIQRHDRQTRSLGMLWLKGLRSMRHGLLLQVLAQLLTDHAAEFHDLGNAD